MDNITPAPKHSLKKLIFLLIGLITLSGLAFIFSNSSLFKGDLDDVIEIGPIVYTVNTNTDEFSGRILETDPLTCADDNPLTLCDLRTALSIANVTPPDTAALLPE